MRVRGKDGGPSVWALTFVLELPFLVDAVLALDALLVVVPPVTACTPF